MIQQQTPVYSPQQQQELRREICAKCIYSACNNNQTDKCSIDSMVCTQDNNKLIIVKTQNMNETCPMSFWDLTNATRLTYKPSAGKGCGCGK